LKISLITVCYNSAATVADTVRSVSIQDYPDLEYIIVDGGSKDNTLEVLEGFRNHISKLISEPDKGLYDALNKGIGLATGEVIGFIHADDFLADATVISAVAEAFSTGTDAVYGDLHYIDATDTSKIVRRWKSGVYHKGSFSTGWMPPHPAFYVRKNVYDRYGKFNLALRSAADYEIMLRFIHRYGISLTYVQKVFVKMRVGGVSNSSVAARKKGLREDLMAWELNGYRKNYLAVFLKKMRKLRQFV
jgi:glycosyltransferase involved in cell wall biosynthesis